MPVGSDKKPLLNSWKQYQLTPADDAQIEKWWEQHPDANLGIITGKVSGITVVDLDTHGNEETQTPLSSFPETFTVRTGNGGYHLYYQYHPGLSISANQYPQYPGLDMRSDGGFVVGPGSITSYTKDGKQSGGEYTIVKDIPLAPFPHKLFIEKKAKRPLSSKIGVGTGGRNDTITSFIGQLLQASKEAEWETEVWPSVQRTNKTYTPPLSEKELRNTFESIVKKETERRSSLILSPMQVDGGDSVAIRMRKNGNGTSYKDMANVYAVLSQHPFYKETIRFNEFRQEIEYNGKPLEDADVTKIQYFLQTDAELHGITDSAVMAAITHYAHQNTYDEAKEWLAALTWDGTQRLKNWLHQASDVEDDDYHAGVGAQWFMGMVRRIMEPGCTFDYVLLLVGGQGIGKTSFFRILGGPWYKSYTGDIDNKDFFLALRGAMIVDLDEGAALYRSEAIKIKSKITDTHDEYRAPYGRVMKKYPRRFVFSMSTNDTEPFRDMTGNRRYWVVDVHNTIRFWWLEENRDQLFAEAYRAYKNDTPLPEVPFESALAHQETHLPDDTWTDIIMGVIRRSVSYCQGDEEYFTTLTDIYQESFPEESLARFGTAQSMRVANIFKNVAGLEKRRVMIDGERKARWYISKERIEKLQAEKLPEEDIWKNS